MQAEIENRRESFALSDLLRAERERTGVKGPALLARLGLDDRVPAGHERTYLMRMVTRGGPRVTWVTDLLAALDAPPDVALFELAWRLRVSPWIAHGIARAGDAAKVAARLGLEHVDQVAWWLDLAARGEPSEAMDAQIAEVVLAVRP